MRKTKKIMSLALASAMAVSLAGCGQSTPPRYHCGSCRDHNSGRGR